MDLQAIKAAVHVLGRVAPFSVRSVSGGGSIARAHPDGPDTDGEWWLGSPNVPPVLNEAIVAVLNAAPALVALAEQQTTLRSGGESDRA